MREEWDVEFAVEGERDAAQEEEGQERRRQVLPVTNADLSELQIQCSKTDINPVAHTRPCGGGAGSRSRIHMCVGWAGSRSRTQVRMLKLVSTDSLTSSGVAAGTGL